MKITLGSRGCSLFSFGGVGRVWLALPQRDVAALSEEEREATGTVGFGGRRFCEATTQPSGISRIVYGSSISMFI